MASLTAELTAELTRRPAWHSEFGKISNEIASLHERVLVIVDDVDRLDGNELRALLRVVRLLGRFTNVHYLMAYDQATVERVLESMGGNGESSEFMEKIVQYPFEVPPVPMVVRRRWSRSVLDAISPLEGMPDSEYSEQREELIRILALGLETPRSAERLREQMVALSPLLAHAEVDALDFTALTWLRIAHHRVWDHVRLNPEEYTSWREGDTAETQAKRAKRIEDLTGRGNSKAAHQVIDYLFRPAGLAGAFSDRQGRLKVLRYFERYFQVGLADDDVSERKTRAALDELEQDVIDSHHIKYLEDVLLGPEKERATLALEIIVSLRRKMQNTSLTIIDFAANIHRESIAMGTAEFSRARSSEHWLAHEVFLALDMKLVSAQYIISRFGYPALTRSAYTVQRSRIHNESRIKSAYAEVVANWVSEVRSEPLAATLKRQELIHMTSFCIWIADLNDHRGFLADRVVDAETLIQTATSFVAFTEWVGVDIKYDVTFRKDEFSFGTGDAAASTVLTEISAPDGVPSYQVSDRKDRDLTEAQRRDFAIRSVLSLQTQ